MKNATTLSHPLKVVKRVLGIFGPLLPNLLTDISILEFMRLFSLVISKVA